MASRVEIKKRKPDGLSLRRSNRPELVAAILGVGVATVIVDVDLDVDVDVVVAAVARESEEFVAQVVVAFFPMASATAAAAAVRGGPRVL